MIIKNFKLFEGQHCETTATGSLLHHLGINLSEPMLFGLGEGLNFIIWNMKTMDFPFIEKILGKCKRKYRFGNPGWNKAGLLSSGLFY